MRQKSIDIEGRFTSRRLDNDERPRDYFEYFVTGRGGFPFDMLRYDDAWPADGEAAARLVDDDRRTIKLHSYREPTVGRWASFLWSVSAYGK